MARKFKYIRINGKIIMDPFDDEDMRQLFITFAEKVLGLKFISGTQYGIDLVCADDSTWGAEGENASWNGDRWVGPQQDIFNLGFGTLNMQNWKWHYVGMGEYSEKNYGKYLKIHTGFEKNIYFRVNMQLDQICMVDASVLRDPKKVKFVFNKKVSNSDEAEDWICIPKQYVRTFNKQPNGEWIENGPYCGPTQKELADMEKEFKQQRVNEIMFAK
jgi:hypothetical protein